MNRPFVRPHGGYQKLLSFQKAQIVYDATVYFCDRFMDRRSRTHDQMIQAARSGKQNIVEGSFAAGFSSESEMRLTSVARASLEELLNDYRDFLRGRGIREWPLTDPRVRELRNLSRQPNATYELFRPHVEHMDPAVSANTIIGLIRVTSLLLDRQLRALEATFVAEGGVKERMNQARLDARARQHATRSYGVSSKHTPPPSTDSHL